MPYRYSWQFTPPNYLKILPSPSVLVPFGYSLQRAQSIIIKSYTIALYTLQLYLIEIESLLHFLMSLNDNVLAGCDDVSVGYDGFLFWACPFAVCVRCSLGPTFSTFWSTVVDKEGLVPFDEDTSAFFVRSALSFTAELYRSSSSGANLPSLYSRNHGRDL